MSPLADSAVLVPPCFQSTLTERVVAGPVEAQLPAELARVGAQRVFVMANRSLQGSAQLARVQAALGPRCVGVHHEIRPFAPREDVIRAAQAAREVRADLLLAVGGGSVIDAAKVALLCLRHHITAPAALSVHAGVALHNDTYRSADASSWLRMMAIPTTFSAAEYTGRGGATDEDSRLLQAYSDPMMTPQVVFNDPSMTLATPLQLLLASGVKAVDHAVERLTSLNADVYSDSVSKLALELLCPALVALSRGEADLNARARLQYGVFMSMAGLHSGVRSNLGHAIGHQLGTWAGVAHGTTSCVTMPAVLTWQCASLGPRDARVRDAIGMPGDFAGEAARALVLALGQPARLRDIGVDRDDLPTLAQRTLRDPLIRNSPRPVRHADDVMEVLELAW